MPMPMNIAIEDDRVRLQREQWQGNSAYISNYPGLLDEVKKHTWTYSAGEHPYLNCSVLGVSLHKFVLQFLYGKDKLEEMLGKSNIIEHLDNNGLNCTYENLHVLSEDMNKAKAFSIDKKECCIRKWRTYRDTSIDNRCVLFTRRQVLSASGLFQQEYRVP